MTKTPTGSTLLLFITLLAVTGCKENNNNNNSKGVVNLSGKISGKPSFTFFIEELTPTDILAIDTITTDESGNFDYSFSIDHAGFYRLRASESDFISIAAEPGENIYITADAANLKGTYIVTGSNGSQIVWHLNSMILKGLQEADSLREVYRENRDNPSFPTIRQQLKTRYNEIIEEQKNFILVTIDNNPESLASILALYQFFEDKLILSETDHFDYFERLSKSLCEAYPHNKHVINLKKRVNDIKREQELKLINEEKLAEGSTAPEIILPNPDGIQIALSSLKGKLVLIDFWAAWCPPCREANVTLRKLYQQYSPVGFEIYSISLDRTRSQWIEAIETDQISWIQVSDLRFMNSPTVSLYNVVDIPHYILVDRQGNIISRGFTIQELEKLIKENI
jgi:peroxiredoxin